MRNAGKTLTVLLLSLSLLFIVAFLPGGFGNNKVEQAVGLNKIAAAAQTTPTVEPTLEVTPTRQTTVSAPETSVTTTTSITETAGATAASTNEPAARITGLLDYTVENAQGEELAEIEDLLIGLENNRVTYAVLSFGGFLDIGDELVAVPFDRLTQEVENNLFVFDVTEEELVNAPNFEADEWPSLIEADWDLDERAYWDREETTAALSEPTIRASEFLGFEIANAELEDLGEIEDVMIGLDSGRVNYAVLSFGGFLNLGEKLFAIPMSGLTFNPQREAIIFAVSEETLEEAPGFDRDNWPDTANPRWDAVSSDYWATPGRLPTTPSPATVAGVAPRTISAASVRASQLLEYEVTNLDGETVGQIEELLVGVTSGQVNYAVLSFDTLDIPDQLYPVPFPALRLDSETNTAIFSAVDEELLADAPGFEPDAWPNIANPVWAETVIDYWTPPLATAEPTVRVTELLDYSLQNLDGETIGQVEDLTVGLTGRYVTYVILSLEQDAQPGEALYPIPYTLLATSLEQDVLVTDLNQKLLQNAPSFRAERRPEITTPNWDLFYRNYWITVGTTPTATVTGELFINESDVRISELLEYPVQDAGLENLGEVEDVLIDLDTEQARYVILSFEGVLDIFNEELFIVPLEQLTVDSLRATILFDRDLEMLEDAPRFAVDEWPDFTDPDWDEAILNFWEEEELEQTGETVADDTPVTVTTVRATELLEFNVVNAQLEPLGDLEEFVVGLDSSRVKYAVLSFGGFLDIGDKLFAVPLSALAVDPINEVIAFDVAEETLENAPGFDDDNWPDMANPKWDVDSGTYWQRQSFTGSLLPSATTSMTAQAVDQSARRASELLDDQIFNGEGEQIGTIEDLLVGAISGQIHFAVVSFEGLGLEDQLYALPATIIGFDPLEPGFMLQVEDTAILRDAPGFTTADWPDVADPGWAEPFWTYWTATPVAEEPAVRASNLLTYDVLGRGGEEIGRVTDFFVGLINENIDYAAISLTADPEDEQIYPVPFSLLIVEPEEEAVVVNVGQKILEDAPNFNANRWPDTSTPQWAVIYRNYWASAVIPPPTSMVVTPNVAEAGIKATELLEFEVETPQLDDLGEIEELVIGLDSGRVKFAVVASEALFDVEERFLAVPLNALEIDPLGYTAVLTVPQEALATAPSIEADNWADIDSPQWLEEFQTYWQNQIDVPSIEAESAAETDQPALTEATVRATRLLDYDVENMAEQELGEIEELVIGFDTAKVGYAVLSFDEGFFDLGEKFFAIPITELTIDYNRETAILDIERETLENAPGFGPADWPDPTNPGWDQEIRAFWQNEKQS